MELSEQQKIVREAAKQADPDRYLAALFAPRHARNDLFALYAFNAEIARVPDEVSEPTLDEIRLQWWRDALTVAAAGEATGSPIADALGSALRRRDLSADRLDHLIDARRFDVIERVMPDAPSLLLYLDDTAGEVFQLAAMFLGAGTESEDAARAAGRAYGLTGLMRAVMLHAARSRLYLPISSLPEEAATRLFQGDADPAFLGLLAEMRIKAKAELVEARSRVRALPKSIQPAFQSLALVKPYLAALERIDPMQSVAEINPLYRLWRLATWRA